MRTSQSTTTSTEQDAPLLAFPPELLIGPVFGTLVLGGVVCTTAYSAISYCIQSWVRVAKVPITPENMVVSTGWLILQCALLGFFLNRISKGLHEQLRQAFNSDHVNKYYVNFFPLTGVAGVIALFALRDLIPGAFVDAPPLYFSAIAGASVVCLWYLFELAFFNNRADKGAEYDGSREYSKKEPGRWGQRFVFDLVYGASAGLLAGGVTPLISTAIESWLGVEFYPLATAVAQISIGYALAQALHPIYLSFKKKLEESVDDCGISCYVS